MFSINSTTGIITLTRGDTFNCSIYVDMGTPVQPVLYPMEPHYTYGFSNLDRAPTGPEEGYLIFDYFDERGEPRGELPEDFFEGDFTRDSLEKYYDGDRLYFALMEPNQKFEDALVKKSFKAQAMDKEDYTINLHFDTEDTEYLLPGNYYYCVKLYRAPTSSWSENSSHVDTITSKTKFVIID